jgi:phosphatidate phosphatase APP1
LWREYLVELLEPQSGEPVTGRGRVLSVTPHTQRVVVSDVDDTIIYTGVSNKLKMLWRLFFHGAADRVPFPGIAALYQAFYLGHNGEQQNPLIYVSRSPWSIYPILDEFFQLHDIPIGPVLQLRDWGISLLHPFPRRAKSYKEKMLYRVIEIYAALPLVLIGDSGQHDPELYTAFAREYPDHVAAIYIRDLCLSHKRTAELGEMRRALAQLGVPLVIAVSTEAIASDAAQRGWLSGRDLAQINRHSAHGQP